MSAEAIDAMLRDAKTIKADGRFDLPPITAYEDDIAPKQIAASKASVARPKRTPIDWSALEGKQPPAREWVLPYWIPAAHMTLLAGRGGIGKTLIAQHIATAVALGHEYVETLSARRVLMWAAEDDADELWRRQLAISSYMQSSVSALADRFFLHSYAGSDVTLMAPVFGKLETTPALGELADQ